MTIIVFLIDTSASMNQRAYLGGRPTLLDVAKGAVETFVKVRQRSQESRGDRYMLLTFEDPPMNIKAGWKENITTFTNELKNLQCYGMTTMGAALKHAFDVLNINRMQTGIDTYGQGRCPYFLEPSVIVVITDGGKLSSNGGVHDDFNLPMHSPIPGSELTREPFRWDQRLFSLVLRLSGTPAVERDIGLVPSDSSPIDAMCEVTGGRSYCITSQRMLMQCIESLVQKVQSGVVINFEKIGPDPPSLDINMDTDSRDGENIIEMDERNGFCGGNFPTWHNCRRLIYVPRTTAQKGFAIGYWPIPESFWPDLGAAALPPRSAHPNVKFTCTSQEPMVIENLPFDKYELEPSPLTQYILARKQPTVCWQIFVANSSKSGEIGHPFGYLKASTNLSCVNMFVMPYNYPVLLPLLEELFKVHRCKPSNDWKTHFGNYLRTMPPYYAAPLKRALIRMGAPTPLASALITDSMENSLSYLVLNYLKRAKTQAKIDFDKLCSDVISKQNNGNKHGFPNETVRVVARSPFKKDLLSHPQLQDKFTQLKDQLNDFSGFVVNLSKSRQKSGCSFRNPFDISRSVLLDQVVRMRANFLQPLLNHTQLIDDDSLHSMPVGQMGNYQEHLKRMTPLLRELESQPVRQHMFGNPFKIDKRMMVDEADIDLVGSTSKSPKRLAPTEPTSPRNNNKRKAGPIPRDFRFNKPESPMHESCAYSNSPPAVFAPCNVYSPSPGYSNPPLLPPVYTMSSELIASLGTPVVTTAPMQNVDASLVSSSWTSLGSSVSSPTQVSSNQLNLIDDPDLSSSTSQDMQDSGRLQIDYKFVNGDSKSLQSDITRSPSPTLPYNPEPGNADRPLPTYSNHVKNSITSTPLSQEKQISLILQEVNSNGGIDFVSKPASSATNITNDVDNDSDNTESNTNSINNNNNNNKSTNGPIQSVSPKNAKLELLAIQKHNLNVRKLIYKEVRRPGRNYTPLFDHLGTIQGTLEVRVLLVKEIIKECLRFKRKILASLLEEFLKKIQAGQQPKLEELQSVVNKTMIPFSSKLPTFESFELVKRTRY